MGTPRGERSKIREAAGLPRMRFHDLRHSAATLLLTQGVHPRAVMELLGHSRITTTMDTYSHVLESVKRETASQMDCIFSPENGPGEAPADPVAMQVAMFGKDGKVN